MTHPTHRPRVWAEIDLDALRANVERARRRIPSRTRILGVVKADAYGHGAVRVSHALADAGVTLLGVGDAGEGIALRESGVDSSILVLGACLDSEVRELIEHRVTPTIHSPERIEFFARAAERAGVRLPVHLLVDTGMCRLGVTPEHAVEHLHAIAREPALRLEGIGTHLATPRQELFSREQLARFERVVLAAHAEGLRPPQVHVASSVPLGRYPEATHDVVRLGGFLYGIVDEEAARDADAPRPVMALRTQVVYLRDLPAGTAVGYGGTFVTERPTRLATLPVGYHDGIPVSLSNRAEVLVRGRRVPSVGRVTMDYLMIDVTAVPGVETGDTVTILGEDARERITAAELAERAGTVLYEIPSRLGPRVVREVRTGSSPGSAAPAPGTIPPAPRLTGRETPARPEETTSG